MAVENLENKHIDVYLSNFIKRYSCECDIADFIAPPFKVKRSSDKYLVYGKENFRVYDNRIGRREHMKEIDPSADESTYTCEEYGLAAFVYDRDLGNVEKPVKLKEEKVSHIKDAQARSRNYRVMQIAASTTLIGSTAIGADWAIPGTGTPVADILAAMISINNAACKKPNSIVMTYQVALTMIQTDEWKEYFKYTWGLKPSGDGLFDAFAGLRHLGLEPKYAECRGVNTYEGCASDPTWETMLDDKVLIFIREKAPTTNSFCFMFSPYVNYNVVRNFYKDEERGYKYTIAEDIDELLVCSDAAHILDNVI